MYLIYGLCLKYLKDPGKSEDAVMQIFEELIKKLRVHRVDNFKAWLYTLARNHCLMVLRKESKSPMVSLEENFVEKADYLHLDDSEALQEKDLTQMEACIDQLKEDQKRCVKLFYLEQKCYKDIVDETGYTMNQVKSNIQNGRRNLKICMDKNI
ncbi:RNA polymerase sigma factor [Albibacterium profundi]